MNRNLREVVWRPEMVYTPKATCFTLWQPVADGARVCIYNVGAGGCAADVLSMQKDGSTGVWSLALQGDHKGRFYTFQVRIDGEWRDECQGINARAVGINGQRGAIIDMRETNPEGWESDRSPMSEEPESAIIYEMHHRDFSLHATSGICHAGKYLALTETGTCNADGLSTGIDHLKELGVTHIHLLPSFDFGSIDEVTGNALDSDDCVPSRYNWGYDPVNYNVPEGSYSTDASDPLSRIREFKQMVMALHKAGLRVVMDVVYNHVYDLAKSPFHKLYPGEFFRYRNGELSNGSGCGNETASEKELMRCYMIESVKYWMQEYHIDGFRFDLMGLHDIQTMNMIREEAQAIDPDVLLYGEGWTAAPPAYPEVLLAMKANASRFEGIAVFGDEMRDGLRGTWCDDHKGAFLAGVAGNEESVKFGLVGAVKHPGVDMQRVNNAKSPWAVSPSQMISYVSCHDDLCIADRIKATVPKADIQERMRLQKLAYTAVLTSRGVPLIWCGDEVMRDRRGIRNCYSSPDFINAIPWNLKTENKSVFDYIRELIRLRRQYKFYDCDITFLPTKGKNVIVTRYGKDLIVVMNSNRRAIQQRLSKGRWQTCLASIRMKQDVFAEIVKVPPQSALILKRV